MKMSRKAALVVASIAIYGLGVAFEYGIVTAFGYLSLILTVGFATKPSDRRLGIVFFGLICLLAAGITMKVLQLLYANAIIIGAIVGATAVFIYAWVTKKA